MQIRKYANVHVRMFRCRYIGLYIYTYVHMERGRDIHLKREQEPMPMLLQLDLSLLAIPGEWQAVSEAQRILHFPVGPALIRQISSEVLRPKSQSCGWKYGALIWALMLGVGFKEWALILRWYRMGI